MQYNMLKNRTVNRWKINYLGQIFPGVRKRSVKRDGVHSSRFINESLTFIGGRKAENSRCNNVLH